MVERGKVVKGLQCLARTKEPTSNPCADCGYIDRPNFAMCVVDVAIDALELLKKQTQWISAKDRMPAETHSMFFKLYGTPKWRDAMWKEESDNVLVAISFEDGSQFVTSGYTQDGKWHTGISKMLPYTVTHWMLLPEPPEEVAQDE